MEYGSHVEVPLPTGTVVNQYDDDTGCYFVLEHSTSGRIAPAGFFGDYRVGSAFHDEILGDLLHAGVDHEDAQQIIDHLTGQGLVI